MRKLCFVLTALLLTAPAFAGVDVTCAQVAVNDANVVISYTASDDANVPRGFGINITVDSGKTITAIKAGTESDDYWVYPGTIDISEGTVNDYGSAIAPKDTNYADREKGGLGTNGVTLEMGSLYHADDVNHPNKPLLTGALLTLTISGVDCNVSIEGNAARGNVVLEDTTEAVVDYNGCYLEEDPECYAGQPDYSEWDSVGKPSCWCNPRQCHGDAAGDLAGDDKSGYWYVGATDLGILTNGWKVLEPATAPIPSGPGIATITNGICADFAHDLAGDDKSGYWRVGATDLGQLTTYWKVLEPATAPIPSGPGVPADCLD